MPKERAYQFMVTPLGEKPTSHSFQRKVRSHAAIVSHRDHITKRQPRPRLRNQGEGLIVFDVNPDGLKEEHNPGLLSGAAQGEDFTTSSKSNKTNKYQYVNLSNTLSPKHLLSNHLSGNTFSPLQHLATYHKPYLPGILNHYICNLTIPIPELDGDSAVPLFRAAWLPVVFHDPVIFQIVILFAATHYATFADPSQYDHLYLELLSLKQFALVALIREIHIEQAMPPITHHLGHCSYDTLIAAAAKMASYEAIFGTTEAFHLHMSTATRLLRLQGGLATLGMNGFLARLLCFIDTNSAFLLGTNLYLEDLGLLNRMPHHQPFPPGGIDDIVPQARSQIKDTNVVNLEHFIGLINLNREAR